MRVEKFTIEKLNLTLVYESLSANDISLDKIREQFGEDVNIQQLNPQLFILLFKDGLQCQLGQNRLSLNLAINDGNLNEENANLLLEKLDDIILALSNDISLNVFGFNYDGKGKVDDIGKEIGVYFRDQILSNWEETFSNIEGEVTNINPDFSITRENIEYNIKLKTLENNEFDFHINVHFNKDDLPENNSLISLITGKYFEALDIITGIN